MATRPRRVIPSATAACVLIAAALWVGVRFGGLPLVLGVLAAVACLSPVVAACMLAFAVPTARPWLPPTVTAGAGLAIATVLAWNERRSGDVFFPVAAAQFYIALPALLAGLVCVEHRDAPGQEGLFRNGARFLLVVALLSGTLLAALPLARRLHLREVARAKAYTEEVAREILREPGPIAVVDEELAGPRSRVGRPPALLDGPGALEYEAAPDGFRLSFLFSSGFIDLECWTYHAPEGKWTHWKD